MSEQKIKKAFQPLVDFLLANAGALVSDILETIVSMASAGVRGSSESKVKRDLNGDVEYIECYYHKTWEPVAEVEYGKKAGTSTRLNNMCKLGAAQWSRQNRVAKAAAAGLIDELIAGTLDVNVLQEAKDEIEANRTKIVPLADLVKAEADKATDPVGETNQIEQVEEIEEDLLEL